MSDLVLTQDEVRVLKALAAGILGATGNAGQAGAANAGEAMGDEHLDKDWAQSAVVKKLPSTWKGTAQVGDRYADLTPADASSLAGFFDWKAKKGAEEVPVRMQNNGKPWHEADAFQAKLLRGFAARNRARMAQQPIPSNGAPRYGTSGQGASAKHTGTPERPASGGGGIDLDDDEIPF